MKETLIPLHQDIIPDWCPEEFSEFFPGTKLDLEKWVVYPGVGYQVNNELFCSLVAPVTIRKQHFETRFFRLNLPSFTIDLDIDNRYISFSPGGYGHGEVIFNVGGAELYVEIYYNQPGEPGVTSGRVIFSHSFGVPGGIEIRPFSYNCKRHYTIKFIENVGWKFYIDGQLRYQAPGNYASGGPLVIRFEAGVKGSARFRLMIDDIIVRRITE